MARQMYQIPVFAMFLSVSTWTFSDPAASAGAFFESYDRNDDKKLSLSEFRNAFEELETISEERLESVEAVFADWDKDESGYLNAREVESGVNQVKRQHGPSAAGKEFPSAAGEASDHWEVETKEKRQAREQDDREAVESEIKRDESDEEKTTSRK